jgi:hypothetical protein
MDWYYFASLTIEMKLNSIAGIFNGFGSRDRTIASAVLKTLVVPLTHIPVRILLIGAYRITGLNLLFRFFYS